MQILSCIKWNISHRLLIIQFGIHLKKQQEYENLARDLENLNIFW